MQSKEHSKYFPAKAGKYKDSLTAEDVNSIFAVRLFVFINVIEVVLNRELSFERERSHL